jgi:hypothetical protein
MNYPLGSFPRFGHQERWANGRRQRATENSIATRQAEAQRNLMVEKEFVLMLDEYVQTMQPQCPQTRAMADEILKRMDRIKRKHEAGERVYYRYLGETLQLFCRSTGTSKLLEGLSPEKLARVAENLGEEYYAKNFAPILTPDCESRRSDAIWWNKISSGQKCLIFAALLYVFWTILSTL